MNAKRALRLRREVLTELRDGELESVGGAADVMLTRIITLCPITWCFSCVTCPAICAEGS